MLLNIAGSKFIFASYVANLFYSWVLRRNIVSRKYYIQWAVPAGISLVLCIGIYWADELMEWLVEWNSSIGETNNSVVVIVLQLTDPAYYAALLNPLPSGTIDFYSSAKASYLEHDGHNEIGFFSLATHSGIFLGLLYLIILLKMSNG